MDHGQVLGNHTFSMPKNLSLPSLRIGPAFINNFSRDVWFEAASFLLDTPDGLDGPYWRGKLLSLLTD